MYTIDFRYLPVFEFYKNFNFINHVLLLIQHFTYISRIKSPKKWFKKKLWVLIILFRFLWFNNLYEFPKNNFIGSTVKMYL